MKTSIVKLSEEDDVKQIIVDTLFSLFKIINNLTRLRPTKRKAYRVTIFGSARAKPNSLVYKQVRKIAKELANMGCEIVTGGGPGLMEAANEGAMEVKPSKRKGSMGIRVQLPFEQNVNSYVKEAYEHETFFSRLHHFALVSDAFVIVPGGIGTTLEAMMVWQLLQVGYIKDIPFIFVGKMWFDFLKWAKTHYLSPDLSLANVEDMAIPECVNTAEEVIAILQKHHKKWLHDHNYKDQGKQRK